MSCGLVQRGWVPGGRGSVSLPDTFCDWLCAWHVLCMHAKPLCHILQIGAVGWGARWPRVFTSHLMMFFRLVHHQAGACEPLHARSARWTKPSPTRPPPVNPRAPPPPHHPVQVVALRDGRLLFTADTSGCWMLHVLVPQVGLVFKQVFEFFENFNLNSPDALGPASHCQNPPAAGSGRGGGARDQAGRPSVRRSQSGRVWRHKRGETAEAGHRGRAPSVATPPRARPPATTTAWCLSSRGWSLPHPGQRAGTKLAFGMTCICMQCQKPFASTKHVLLPPLQRQPSVPVPPPTPALLACDLAADPPPNHPVWALRWTPGAATRPLPVEPPAPRLASAPGAAPALRPRPAPASGAPCPSPPAASRCSSSSSTCGAACSPTRRTPNAPPRRTTSCAGPRAARAAAVLLQARTAAGGAARRAHRRLTRPRAWGSRSSASGPWTCSCSRWVGAARVGGWGWRGRPCVLA